jgi:Tol biopolymer transport system component
MTANRRFVNTSLVLFTMTTILVLAGVLAAQAQNPPGRILTTPGNDNVIECNLDASNCFYVVANQEGNVGFPFPQSPSVASDGTIAFTAVTSSDGTCGGPCYPHVFMMNADGTNVRQLTFNANTGGYGGELNATISPDASTVAFLTNLNTAPGGTRPPQIYLANADGSNLRQLTPFQGGPDPSQGYVDGLAWSPDSQSMAFRGVVYTSVCGTYFGDPIFVRVIGMIGADGSNPQVVACDNNDGYVTAVDWSPDGTLLAYTRNVQHCAQGGSGCVGEPAIAFIDLSGQDRYSTGITSAQLSGSAAGDSCQSGPHCIHFSPDSTTLAYDNTFTMDGNPCQTFCFIGIINLDGTNQTNTPLTVGGAGFWWMAGPAVPAAAQMTLVPTTLEYWPGFSQQLVPSLLDGDGNLIMHTAQSFSLPFVYNPSCGMQIGPYGLTTGAARNGTDTPFVNASNAGLTSDSIPFTCWNSPPCTYSLSFSSENFGSSGGSDQVTVIADRGQNQSACPWNANSNVAWIVVTSPLYGAGNGSNSMGFTVAANNGEQRQGTMTIAGQTFTVTQDAFNTDPPGLAVNRMK